MAKPKYQKEKSEARNFLSTSSQDGAEASDVSKSEGAENPASQAASEPSHESPPEAPKAEAPKAKAPKSEAKKEVKEAGNKIPGKFRKLQ